MLKWFAKKYAVSFVNDALEKLQNKVDVTKYVTKIQTVIKYLQSLLEKLEDGKVTEEEAEAIVAETQELFK